MFFQLLPQMTQVQQSNPLALMDYQDRTYYFENDFIPVPN